MPESLPAQASLAGELVAAASRDITTYISKPNNPNRTSVAEAALTSLNAAIRVLCDARRQLLVETHKAYDLPDWAAGNSGPGFPTKPRSAGTLP